MSTTITIATDFSPYPAGRFRADGPDSGERFREDFLVPALKRAGDVVVQIDGTDGYQTSFLEEAFGGLVRAGFSKKELEERLRVVSNDEAYRSYKELILEFIRTATDD